MKKLLAVICILTVLVSCNGQSGKSREGADSTSTAPVTDPSYTPKKDEDSAIKHMNLDSTVQKDSATRPS